MSNPLFDIYKNVEFFKELWDSLEAKYMAKDTSSKKFLDSNKPKRNNIVGPSVVNMVEHNISSRLNIVGDNIGSAFISISNLNDSILWHARLGYVQFKWMQDISKDGLIPAFDMETKKCKTCMLMKITKKRFQNVKCKSDVLELIYSDLCDLHATPSLRNKINFVTFINDALKFGYVYILHTKDEALDNLKVFKTEVELQQGSLIKRLRTNRGELWDSLEAKYMAKDTSSKKFLVSNVTNYKMTDSRPILEQYNELL
nr:zinc finger, CCHC-type [Tanacetum cinerariifolium]